MYLLRSALTGNVIEVFDGDIILVDETNYVLRYWGGNGTFRVIISGGRISFLNEQTGFKTPSSPIEEINTYIPEFTFISSKTSLSDWM